MRVGGPRAAGYREGASDPAKDTPPRPSFVRRRYYGFGLIVLFFDLLLVGSLVFLTWHRLDVACNRSGPRDLRCRAVTSHLFSQKERTVDLYGTTAFVVAARDDGVGGRKNLRAVLVATHAKGRRTELGEHPQAERLVAPLSEYLADPARPTVEVVADRPRVAYGAAVVFWVVAVFAGAFAVASSLTLRVVDGALRIERRYLPGVTRTRVVPLRDVVRLAHDGPGQLPPLRLVLADGSEVPLFTFATSPEADEVRQLTGRASGIRPLASGETPP